MSRPAKATPEELAGACKKLKAAGDLTIHTLRQELGGGGADYLTRGLRAWRQQQADEARAPTERMVSTAMRAALAEEMQRVRDDAAQEVHALYADDRAHLDFCLSEIRRLEKENEHLEGAMSSRETENRRSQAKMASEAKGLASKVSEERQRADRLTTRLEELQRQEKANTAELAVAREQRLLAERRYEEGQVARIEEQRTASSLATAYAEGNIQLAAMQERCAQQQETLRYMRADLETKAQAVERLAHALGQAAARAEAALEASRQGGRHQIILRRPPSIASVKPPRPDA